MSEMSEEQAEDLIRGFSENKMSIPKFLNEVVKTKDTSKVGNLNEEELGYPKLPVRSYKELEVFSREIAGSDCFADYFHKMSENTLATSLSKEGFLLKIAVTQKKELADLTPKKVNKGWYKKGNNQGQGGSEQ